MAHRSGQFNEWGKTRRGFSYALLEAGKQLTDIGKRDFTYLAQDFLSEVDANWPHNTKVAGATFRNGAINTWMQSFGGDREHPWYYGQLHDSVAVRVSDKNKTVSVSYMPQRATNPQHTSASDGLPAETNIIGAQKAMEAAASAQYFFLPGVQIQLLIGVPYAEKVNESSRHMGFADALFDDLVDKIETYMLSPAFREKTKKVKFSGRTSYGKQTR